MLRFGNSQVCLSIDTWSKISFTLWRRLKTLYNHFMHLTYKGLVQRVVLNIFFVHPDGVDPLLVTVTPYQYFITGFKTFRRSNRETPGTDGYAFIEDSLPGLFER
jgi:hypothetical protein